MGGTLGSAHLLLETEIPLGEIGWMVGYSSRSSFRRTMRTFLGMPASEYRRRAPRILERGGPPPAGSDTDEYWERMLAGELSDDEARALDAYLARLAPASTPTPEPDEETARWTRLRETLAEGYVFTLPHLVDFADRLGCCGLKAIARAPAAREPTQRGDRPGSTSRTSTTSCGSPASPSTSPASSWRGNGSRSPRPWLPSWPRSSAPWSPGQRTWRRSKRWRARPRRPPPSPVKISIG